MTTFTLYSLVDESEATYSSIISFTPEEGMVRVEVEHCKMYGTQIMTVEAAREMWKELIAGGYQRFGDVNNQSKQGATPVHGRQSTHADETDKGEKKC